MRGESLLANVTAELIALYPDTRSVRRHPDILLEKLMPFIEQTQTPEESRLSR
jgi:hypothetical protein